MQPTNQKSVFRHRGYQCAVCDNNLMVFGEDPEPKVCETCGTENQLTKKWDHKVRSSTIVTDFDVSV